MKAIPLIFIIVSALLLLLLIGFILLKVLRRRQVTALLSGQRADKKLIYQLLCTAFSPAKIIPNLILPAQEKKPGEPDYHILDCVLVCRAGIVACFVQRPCAGVIDNSGEDKWVLTDKRGKHTLADPFEKARPVVAALNAVMKKQHLSNNPIIDLVVYPVPSSALTFTEESQNLLTSDRLLPHLRDINRERFMDAKEMRDTVKLLKKCKSDGMRYLRFKKAAEVAEQANTEL